MNSKPTHLSKALTTVARQMNRLGLNQGRSGNVSARHQNGMLITASGVHFDEITEAHLVATHFDGQYEGPLKPSSEHAFHAAIYKSRPDAGAVVHVHSPWATTLACLNRSIPPFHYMVAVAGGRDIPCIPYRTFGTPELAQQVGEAVRDRDACLMGNHGQVALADTPEAALELALEVENLARCYGQALSVGEPTLLSNHEMEQVLERFQSYRRNAQKTDTTQ